MMTSNRALRELLADVGYGTIQSWVRIVHLPNIEVRTVSQLRSDDIGLMLSIDAVVTKITGVALVCILQRSNASRVSI